MRIVLDNIVFSLQKSGGVSILWIELINKIIKDKRFEVQFLEYTGAEENLARKSINIDKDKFISHKNRKLKLERYSNVKLDINEPFIFISSYYRVSSNKNAINFTIVHDFTYEFYRKGIAKLVHSYQKNYAVKKSDGIICISENTKKDLLHFVPKVDPEKIRVIYNGVSEDFFKIDEDFNIAEKDSRFSSLENFKYLLYIGHRTSYKNFPIAVAAAAKVKENYKFVVVGESFNEEEIKVLATHFEENEYIVISRLNNKVLNALYNKAFALLYPSSYEGFGIPIVEAMKTHCLVIASNNSSIPEVAGDAAILCNSINEDEFVNGIYLLEDEFFRNQLIRKGINQSRKFSWDLTMTNYLDFFEELFNKNEK
ncbi:glycosyltransferase family 1 protein [Empedobacter sp.]|uniref:glycosyltransferase family 4 protein n=1 Tax=Empedobacter sp. TaxID=1927715 RepID=UPI0028A70E63|nr:glycosyltransferase family 1 protein [Empedobacter sp.]